MPEPLFRHGFCKATGCGMAFWICRSCDRGQRYCGECCRQQARREQHRRANRRHQQSLEGRLDHRDRQRAYRERCVMASVTDQGRRPRAGSGRIPALTERSMFSPIQRDVEKPGGESGHLNSVRVFCCVCGCWGLQSWFLKRTQLRMGVSIPRRWRKLSVRRV